MQGPDYIFALQDKNFNFWKISESGAVTITAAPYFLKLSPEGWNDIAIQNIRNKFYKAIDRSVTIPLSYIGDGGKITKHVLLNRGQFEELYLVIANQQLDYRPGVGYKFWYQQIYRGQMDWQNYDHTGAMVTCSTLEDGLPKYLKANDKHVYEFPVNVPEAVMIKMDGIKLHETLNYQPISDFDIHANSYSGLAIVPVPFLNSEGDHTGVQIESQSLQSISGLPFLDALQLDNFLIKNTGPVPIIFNVLGNLEFTCTARTASVSNIRFRFARSNHDFSTQNEYPIGGTTDLIVGQTYNIPFNFNIPLAVNEKLFLHHIWNLTGTDSVINFTNNSRIKTNFITRYQPTYIRALRPQYLFEQFITKLTDGNYTAAVSAYLNDNRTTVITSGNAIRGFDEATIKMKFEDFFKIWDCTDSAGLIDRGGTVDIAQEDTLVDLTNYIELGEPALHTFKMTMAKDLLFNAMEAGYPEIRNDVGVLNGNQEFNTKFFYGTDAQTATATLDKVCPVKASCYDIEKIRTTTFEKNTTDFKSDNDNYIIHIGDVLQPVVGNYPAHYLLDRTLNPFITAGLIEPETVFNVKYSPARNITRMGSHLHGRFYKSDTRNIYFRSADKNKALVCAGLIENKNWNIGELNTPKMLPVYFDGEFSPPDNLLSLLDINPLQVFRFSVEGYFYFGILEQISIQKSNRKAQSIRMRSAAINDLTKLEKYAG